jgi:hypothetical protein
MAASSYARVLAAGAAAIAMMKRPGGSHAANTPPTTPYREDGLGSHSTQRGAGEPVVSRKQGTNQLKIKGKSKKDSIGRGRSKRC